MALTQVSTSGIKDGSISSNDLADGSISTSKVADGSISTVKVADDAITADKLNNTGVTAGSYTLSSVTVDAQGRVTAASSGTPVDADKIIEGNTEVEAVDTGSDGHIKATTEGSERFRVGPAGQMGIGGANYGTSGQVLMSGGASAAPTWGDVSSSPTIEAVASGTIPNGAKVVVQSDGTVTTIVRDQASDSITSAADVTSGSGNKWTLATVYIPDGNKVVVFYYNMGNDDCYAIAGSISGSSITWGSAVEVTSDQVESGVDEFDAVYDTNADRIMCVYRNKSVSDKGMARVLSLNGTTLTVGSEIYFNNARTTWPCAVFDSSQNKVVIFFGNGSQDRHSYVVGTISTTGNTATFQSVQLISGNYTARYSKATFSDNNQILLAYYNVDGGRGYARICTLSGNTLTLGSQETFHNSGIQNTRVAYHSANNEFYVAYTSSSDDRGRIVAASFTGTGTGLQFGSNSMFESYQGYRKAIAYHSKTEKVHLAWLDASGQFKYTTVSSNGATAPSLTIPSETSIQNTQDPYMVFNPTDYKLLYFYRRTDVNPQQIYVRIHTAAYDSTNLEANNYVGISDAAYTNGQTATIQVVGSVDDAQSGLTAGKAYYIQKDGTLATTADTPSVVAGVALSATKLLIK